MRKKVIFIGTILTGVVIILTQIWIPYSIRQQNTYFKQENKRIEEEHVQETFSYKGKSGKDALTLLKEKTTVEQKSSGLVSSIHGRKADSRKREYWAFYVNGAVALVGPAEYKTKDSDVIEWKIEKY